MRPFYAPFYEAREYISDILRRDLVGPVEEDEWIAVPPVRSYAAGKLYPRERTVREEAPETPAVDTPVLEPDVPLSLASHLYPSSMGLTFRLPRNVSSFEVSGSFALYEPHDPGDVPERYAHILLKEGDRRCRQVWERRSHTFTEAFHLPEAGGSSTVQAAGCLTLHAFFRAADVSGECTVTLALTNDASAANNDLEDSARCIFQPELTVRAQQFAPLTARRPGRTVQHAETELLYGKNNVFACGHGCSVFWDPDSLSPNWIRTSFLPHEDVRQMRPAGSDGPELSMEFLAEAPDEQVLDALADFTAGYAAWLEGRLSDIPHVPRELRVAARTNLAGCKAALSRMRAGTSLLRSDPQVLEAFRLTNKAMLLQRRHAARPKDGAEQKHESARWYPFQLAFVLYEISSFADPAHVSDGAEAPDRDTGDLLWFPTGGGKTEAYLGISAFAIFLRRLRDPENGGVTVMMRYTMRLLTLQQFERASLLIAACEKLRLEHGLGGPPISIGLWVGESLTPNKLADAARALQAPPGTVLSTGNPVQITVCPWCGSPLDKSAYEVDVAAARMRVRCQDEGCLFHANPEGLPVHLVDEAIYDALPAFLVATIDKFAQMPLKEETARLFGIGTPFQPPELILQDELHLISGQLGTIAGLYEPAVRFATQREDGFGAKIIASTATIRGADGQMLSLYGLPCAQFPPPALSADDLYFAAPAAPEEKPARRYMGIMGSGLRPSEMLVRVYSALLFAVRSLAQTGRFPDEVLDNFWTVTGYFNTIRELGQAASQITDEVLARFHYLASTKFARICPGVEAPSHLLTEELTSRLGSADIAHVLQHELLRSYRRDGDNRDVYDFLIATNMISVGVDIGRLGTMVVAGQPKSGAEYIQATSRVGRAAPGLVVCVYYPSRSRDRSHYEQFTQYHASLFRFVEPVSLTPFSPRAQDRALHALFVTLCRFAVPGLADNSSAGRFDSSQPAVRRVISYIESYVQRTDPEEADGVRKRLEDICRRWEEKAAFRDHLQYKDYGSEQRSLLATQDHRDSFYTINSMRSVDTESGLYLLRRKRGDGDAPKI